MEPDAPSNREADTPKDVVGLAERLGSAGLAFLGVSLSWRRKPSDLTINTLCAERWESEFSRWEIDKRTVNLGAHEYGYRVHLGDGHARFKIETGDAYDRALKHAASLLETVGQPNRAPVEAVSEVQYLLPVDSAFEQLRDHLMARLLNQTFLSAVRAEAVDFAYICDVRIDKRAYQIEAGPLHDFEIPNRFDAVRLPDPLPDVAVFFGVTRRWRVSAKQGLETNIQNAIAVANRVREELQQ